MKVTKFLKLVEIKRMARVPYATVTDWIEVGHPIAGLLPSIDLALPGKRHSYRVRAEDWEAFQAKLSTPPRAKNKTTPMHRPVSSKAEGPFSY